MIGKRSKKQQKEFEELKSQSKANNDKNEEDGMSQIDPTLDVVSDVSKMKENVKNVRTQVGFHEDTLNEHGNEILGLKERIDEMERRK